MGGVLFCVSNERRDFELGDIGLRAVWRVSQRVKRGTFPFAGRRGMPEPLSLWGEVWFFWAGGGDEAWEGDLSYGRGMEG